MNQNSAVIRIYNKRRTLHFPFERIFESKTEQTEQKCTFIAMYILDYQQKKQHVYPLLHRNGTNTGVTVSAHCSQERPAFRKSYEGKNRINLDCCIFLI